VATHLLDRGEKEETLLALPKLAFSRQLAASTWPVEPASDPVWNPADTGFLGSAADLCC
jgi:hypothetical protein